MEAGALNLKLMADITDLVTKMDQAKNTVNGSMDSMEKAFGVAKGAFIGLVGIGSVGAFAGMITSSIEATGKLHDLAIQTGASEAALGEFRKMGAYTETSADTIANAMNKLGKNMALSTIDSKGAAVAIQALGIDFNTLKSMSPEDQMLVIAKSMNQFADGADKGAAAQALWGKEGAKLLPFIKDLGDAANEITARLTDQEVALKKTQTAMADAFGDNLKKITTDSGLWRKELATGITPALLELTQAYIDSAKEARGLSGAMKSLNGDGTISEWSRNGVIALTYLMEGFGGVLTAVKTTSILLNGFWMLLGVTGNGEKFKEITAEIGIALDKTWGEKSLGRDLRERMADLKGITGVMDENGKTTLDVKAKLDALEAARKAEEAATKLAEAAARAHTAELRRQEDQYIKLVSSIDEKILSDTLALESNGKLTEADKIEIKLLADLTNSNIILTDAQLETALGKINLLRETEALIDAQKREKKETEDAAKEYVALIEKLQKGTDATTAQIDKQRESNDTLGLNRQELMLLSIQKDLDTAKTWDQKAAWAEQNFLGQDLVDQYTNQATALRTLAGLKEQGIHVKAAVDARIEWERTTKAIGDGLSNALTDALMNGRSLWDAFKSYLINSILEGAIKNALSSVIQSGLNSMFGTTLFSSAGTAVGAGAGGAVAGGGIVAGAGSVLGVGSAGFTGTGITGSLGIGASAGVGVSTAGVTGGSAGAAVGTDLGILGGSGAAGTGSAGAAGIGVLGPLAGVAAVLVIGELLKQGQRPFELAGTGSLSTSGLSVEKQMPNGSEWVTPTSASYQKLKFTDGDMGFAYQVMGDGVPIEAVSAADFLNKYHGPAGAVSFHGAGGQIAGAKDYQLIEVADILSSFTADGYDAATLIWAGGVNYGLSEADVRLAGKSRSLPGFYAGGMFDGGLRIVGERGPELEATGPSRIFDAQTTASMLRSGGASNDDVIEELRLVRQSLERGNENTKRTFQVLDGQQGVPFLVEVVT